MAEYSGLIITKRAVCPRHTAHFVDAIASLSLIKLLTTAARVRTIHSGWLGSATVNEELGAALRKPNLLIDPIFGFTPCGAEFEGLIHAARCSTCSLTELPVPAVSGRDWPGGLSSPSINPSDSRRAATGALCSRSSHPLAGWG